jgi:hypothetical protein
MKKILLGLFTLVSISGFTSEYTCEARLNSGENVEQVELDMVTTGVRNTSIGSIQFNASEVDSETIVLSIFNRAKLDQAATATTFVPKEGKSSNLLLRLPDGSALIDCMSK